MASGQPPSFYHILMNPSSPHLPLPLKFVKKHLKNRTLKKPILKSANGGYSWKLRMKKIDDHTFCFVNGWCKVVKDLGLLFGEFLLFKYVGSSVFLMHVYNVNGCEKILVPRINNNFKVVNDDEVSVFEEDDEVSVFDDDDDDDDAEEEDDDDADADVEYDLEEDEDVEDDDEDDEEDNEVEFGDEGDDDYGEDEDDVDVDGDDGDPFFVITSSKRNRKKLRLPLDLVAMAYMYNKETITLKNDDGYEKEMPVRSYKLNKSARYYVAEGWEEFQRINNVSEGDECVLKFITIEDKLCLAKVTKKKTRFTEVNNDDDDGMDDDNDMDDDDGMDEEGEAEDAEVDDSNVDGDDIFDDDVDDEGKGKNSKLVNDDHDVDGEDGDPFFILTCSEKNLYKLCFSADFVELAGITTKETLILKNLDGYEKELHVRSQRNHQSKSYYLAGGWKEFQRISKISKGDKFVFKFITSEDKFCVAKITKKRTPARSLPPAAKAPVTEVVDGLYDKDVDDNDMNVDDGMDGKDVVVDDNKGKDEYAEPVNDGMDSKDVVVDENKDEDENVEPVDDGMDSKDVVVDEVEFGDDDEDDGEDEDDVDVDGDDGDPFFVITSSKRNKKKLRLPLDLVAMAYMYNKETITLKNDDGYEKEMPVRSYKLNKSARYYVAEGWEEFQQINNVSEGDECVLKFITSEDKLCLAKVTKKRTRTMEVDNDDDDDGMDEEVEAEDATEDDSNVDGDDIFDDNEGKGENSKLVNDDEDADEDDHDVDGDDGDPSFVLTSSDKNQYKLLFSTEFVASAGINTKQTITLKNLDGYEKELHVRSHRNYRLKSYYLAGGWKEFQQSSNISKGDKFVFKFITSEDKFCVAKITNRRTPARSLPPAAEAPLTEFVNDMDDKDVDDNDLNVDDGVDGKNLVVDENKDEDEIVEPVDDMDGKDLVIDDNKEEDESVELVDDGMDVVVDDNKDEDENVEPIDDGMDVKNVVVDDNKDEDENVEPFDDGMVGKDMVVDDNKDEDENIEPVDDGMDGKDVVVDDNKHEDENVELVDNGMDVDADDNKHEDKDAEFVVTIAPGHYSRLALPKDIVVLAGIESKENIIMKSLDGNETELYIWTDTRHRTTHYHLSAGWTAFKRSNNISEGDECVFKYITSEDKMCLAKVTKKKTAKRKRAAAIIVTTSD